MKTRFKIIGLVTVSWLASSSFAMTPLNDSDLSNETGQSLLTLTNIGQSDASNPMSGQNMGFYKVGMEATIDINANIRKLQLGCGGTNGPGCDIDIDNLSLSGNPGVGNCPSGANRASCDATLTNPFIQFAIKNPNSASTRQIVGVRLGAAQAVGLLTAGLQNSDTPNGINSLSGYMHAQATASADTLTGTVKTAPGYFDASDPNNRIQGNLNAPFGTVASFHLDNGGFWIPGFDNLNFTIPGVTLNGSRLPALALKTTVKLPDLVLGRDFNHSNCNTGECNQYGASAPGFVANYTNTTVPGNTFTTSDGAWGGVSSTGGTVPGKSQGGVGSMNSTGTTAISDTLEAYVDNCSGIGCLVASNTYYVNMYTRTRNIVANVQVNQPLGLIHSLAINSPTSLSLQSQAVHWPGQKTDDIAQPGWWLSVSDPVLLGNIVPTSPVDLCQGGTGNPAMCAYPQIADQVNTYLASNPPSTSDLSGLIFKTAALGIQVGPTGATGGIGLSPLGLTVNGLTLSNQFFSPNCYGGLKFC